MVVEVLIARGDGDDPLGEHGTLLMDDEEGMPRVGDGGVEGVEEPEAVADLAEEQGAGIGGEPAALEIGDDGLVPESGKVEGLVVTLRHSGGLAFGGVWASLIHILLIGDN